MVPLEKLIGPIPLGTVRPGKREKSFSSRFCCLAFPIIRSNSFSHFLLNLIPLAVSYA
jgi:hypothetical protein